MTLEQIGKQGKEAAYTLSQLDAATKNKALNKMADLLIKESKRILKANEKDLAAAADHNIEETMLDRLRLTTERICEMAEGLRQVATLSDPIGMIVEMWPTAEGLMIGKKRVPLGVIGIIYEARPNVTTDAAGLCFKSGNAVILRGGKEAFYSNQLLVTVLQEALNDVGLPLSAIQLIQDTSRETAKKLMQLNQYIDVLIPRGGAGLINAVVATATIPVIQTGTGNCHIYVDKEAQLEMAGDIVVNAKCQRPSVCNAVETVVVHKDVAEKFLPMLEEKLKEYSVELRADERAFPHLKSAVIATEEDWETEYLDYILAIKVVDSAEEAIEHINIYSSSHSEAIITDNYFTAQLFQNQIDSAAVYVNASTRFTDGFMFGFGAEIGISNQKLHARGPMGLKELTTIKYVINGTGQIRK